MSSRAGINGLRCELRLPPPVQVNPATLRGPLAGAPEAPARLPTSVEKAVEKLNTSTVLSTAMGPELLKQFCMHRKADAALVRDLEYSPMHEPHSHPLPPTYVYMMTCRY
jgi:glutamine synthetase